MTGSKRKSISSGDCPALGHLCQDCGARAELWRFPSPVAFETHPRVSAPAPGFLLAGCAAPLPQPSAPTCPSAPMRSLCRGGHRGGWLRGACLVPGAERVPGQWAMLGAAGGRAARNCKTQTMSAHGSTARLLPSTAAWQGMLPRSSTSTRTACLLPPRLLFPCRDAGQARHPGKGWALVPTAGSLDWAPRPQVPFLSFPPHLPGTPCSSAGDGEPRSPFKSHRGISSP